MDAGKNWDRNSVGKSTEEAILLDFSLEITAFQFI